MNLKGIYLERYRAIEQDLVCYAEALRCYCRPPWVSFSRGDLSNILLVNIYMVAIILGDELKESSNLTFLHADYSSFLLTSVKHHPNLIFP